MWGWWGAPAAEFTEADCFWYMNPSEQEKAVLVQFRAALEEQGALYPRIDDDHSLLRFLKAREFQLDKALAMYLEMKEWREAEGIDSLYNDDKNGKEWTEVDELLQVYPHFTFNVDRYGRPVYYELLGKSDAHKLFEVMPVERLIRYHCWTWERYLWRYLPAASAKAGKHICTTLVIIDLEGFTLGHFNFNTQKLLNTFSKIDQDHYPEHLGTMIVINTPIIFRTIWAAIQPMLQERTRKKIHLLGSDYQAELFKFVDPDSLPTQYGGTAVQGPGYASAGPWDDPRYAAPGQPGPNAAEPAFPMPPKMPRPAKGSKAADLSGCALGMTHAISMGGVSAVSGAGSDDNVDALTAAAAAEGGPVDAMVKVQA